MGKLQCPFLNQLFTTIGKLREEKGTEVIKAEIRRLKQKSRSKLMEENGPEVIKAQQKLKSRNKLIVEKGPTLIRKQENARNLTSRGEYG